MVKKTNNDKEPVIRGLSLLAVHRKVYGGLKTLTPCGGLFVARSSDLPLATKSKMYEPQ